MTAQPLRFMEYLLEHPIQIALLSRLGAVVANVPGPARYAVHKLIVAAQREAKHRTKVNKDLLQAAALIQHLQRSSPDELAEAWQDALGRGPIWRKQATRGRAALCRLRPELEVGIALR